MRRTPGKTPQEREGYWIGIIHEARNHAAGVTAYCAESNISKNTYYAWFRRLREVHAEWQCDLPSTPELVRTKRALLHLAKADAAAAGNEPGQSRPRRKFTAAYKAQILREAEESTNGRQAAMLKREGLCASHLQKWRQQRDTTGLEPRKRGRKANPQLAETKRLQKQNAKLAKELEQAKAIIEFQKKIAKLLRSSPSETGAKR